MPEDWDDLANRMAVPVTRPGNKGTTSLPYPPNTRRCPSSTRIYGCGGVSDARTHGFSPSLGCVMEGTEEQTKSGLGLWNVPLKALPTLGLVNVNVFFFKMHEWFLCYFHRHLQCLFLHDSLGKERTAEAHEALGISYPSWHRVSDWI